MMSKIVKTVSLAFLIPTLVFGAYVISHGHLTPGGGFQGGAIIATSIVLLLVAFGAKDFRKAVGKNFLSVVESIALLGFIALAFIGLGNSFFYNALANEGGLFGESVSFGVNMGVLNTAGTIPLMNFVVGLEVACALTIILIAMGGRE